MLNSFIIFRIFVINFSTSSDSKGESETMEPSVWPGRDTDLPTWSCRGVNPSRFTLVLCVQLAISTACWSDKLLSVALALAMMMSATA